LFNPRKQTRARVTYADINGLEGQEAGEKGKNGFSGPLLNQLGQMDGFVQVVRVFDDPNAPHSLGEVDPARDVAIMDAELLLNDLLITERRIERLAEERKKGGVKDRTLLERESALLERVHAALAEEIPLRNLALSAEEEKLISGFSLLTRKPMLILFNLGDEQNPPDFVYPHQHSDVAALKGKLEMELAQLPPEDAEIFMAEYGIKKLGMSRVIERSYKLLGRQSFFTVGEDEVRAWTIRCGATAYEAAGAIHSDLQKGFIRAETIDQALLLELGGLSEARAKGQLRLEGKDYLVQDGEIVHIRFNV
ncbi:MAG TPA: DUF933 domain-containing protein, partial [Anaerolineales bacterium]|nr:DUF933 domain-containing protein [Anaerolineales bacterium]